MVADLLAALAGGTQGAGPGDENSYLAQDPFYSAGLSLERNPMPRPTSNADAIFGPALQGLLSGVLTGYGKSNAEQTAYNDYASSPLLKALTKSENIGPVADGNAYAAEKMHDYSGAMPAGWTPKIGKADLLQAALVGEQQKALTDETNKAAFDILGKAAGKSGDPSAAINAIAAAKGPDGTLDLSKLSAALGSKGSDMSLSKYMDTMGVPKDEAIRAGLTEKKDVNEYVANQLKMNADLPEGVTGNAGKAQKLQGQYVRIAPILQKIEANLPNGSNVENWADLQLKARIPADEMQVLQSEMPLFAQALQAASPAGAGGGRGGLGMLRALGDAASAPAVIASGRGSSFLQSMTQGALDGLQSQVSAYNHPGGPHSAAAKAILDGSGGAFTLPDVGSAPKLVTFTSPSGVPITAPTTDPRVQRLIAAGLINP